jgi:hypothetical protein
MGDRRQPTPPPSNQVRPAPPPAPPKPHGADISLRDYFAAHAMAALLSQMTYGNQGQHCAMYDTNDRAQALTLAFLSFQAADAMLAARASDRQTGKAKAQTHPCYRCGKPTSLGTAWCQACLDEADEHRKLYPRKPLTPLPRPRR